MATLKLTIDGKRSYADGRVPVIYRLTHKTQTTRIESGVKVFRHEWDTVRGRINKIHPESKALNIVLGKKLLLLEKRLLEHTSEAETISLTELKELLLTGSKTPKINFYAFAAKEVQTLQQQQRFGNAEAYETATNRLVQFAGKELMIDQITYSLLTNFDAQLVKEELSRNTVAGYMREIRALINIAIKKGLLDRGKYPFEHYKIRTQKTISRSITKADLEAIKFFPLEKGRKLWHSRNIFFLIYNLIGISFMDLALLKPDNVQHGRVVYRRRKTGKIYSIKITPEASRIISLYRNENSKYLISYLNIGDVPKSEERKLIALKLRTCNKQLKRLGKQLELPIQLTTYVARYTWANVARSLGYPKDQIAEALGHEYGNKVTGIYLDNYGSEIIDGMNQRVTAQ